MVGIKFAFSLSYSVKPNVDVRVRLSEMRILNIMF